MPGTETVSRQAPPSADGPSNPVPSRRRFPFHRRIDYVVAVLLAVSTVVVSVGATPEAVTIRVRDDGPGIPEPLRSRLFQRFTRGDMSRNRAAGSSTGLGLAIVHAVVTAHSGTIDVDGTPGQTSFTVTLPAAP